MSKIETVVFVGLVIYNALILTAFSVTLVTGNL